MMKQTPANKILLLGINARFTHSNPALFYLKSVISDLDIDTTVIEFTIAESPEKIAGEIIRIKPDILAVSVYIWNSFNVKNILPLVKSSLPQVLIVLGGPEVSYNSAEWVSSFSEIDLIITGPGEASFREAVLSGTKPEVKTINGRNPHFSMIRFPYTAGDLEKMKGRYIYYESSRGCPFRCTYCLSSVTGGEVEYRHVEQVTEELEFLVSYNPPLIKFVDRTFNLKKDHYSPVWRYIAENFSRGGTRFHFEIFPELLDDDDLQFLKKIPSGLFQFEMGIQSTNSVTMKEIRRPGSWDRAEENIRILAGYGNIHLHTDLIAGLPYQGFDSYSDSFNKVYSLGAEHFQSGFLKVLPGTEMRNSAEKYGIRYSPYPPYEVTENRWITAPEIEKLKIISELVDLFHNPARFTETEKFIIQLYENPFTFYNRLAGIFTRAEKGGHRTWEYLAEALLSLVRSDNPELTAYLTDCLRWDWCSLMKHHHLPAILKSGKTADVKKRGYRYFASKHGDVINYKGISFKKKDLKRSIFFIAESDEFKKVMMTDELAMFLPDKRIIFFNTPDSLST